MFDYNNLKYFMFTIILNKKQIRWTFFFRKIWFRNQIQIKQFQFCKWFFEKIKLRKWIVERHLFIYFVKQISKCFCRKNWIFEQWFKKNSIQNSKITMISKKLKFRKNENHQANDAQKCYFNENCITKQSKLLLIIFNFHNDNENFI